MAYQAPAFYAFHALRDAAVVTTNPVPAQPNFPIFDGRQGEVFSWSQALSVGDPQVNAALDGTPLTVEKRPEASLSAPPQTDALDPVTAFWFPVTKPAKLL